MKQENTKDDEFTPEKLRNMTNREFEKSFLGYDTRIDQKACTFPVGDCLAPQPKLVRCPNCFWEFVALRPDVCPLCVEREISSMWAANCTGLREALRSIANFEETEYEFGVSKIEQMIARAHDAIETYAHPDVRQRFNDCGALLRLFQEFMSLFDAHGCVMTPLVKKEFDRFHEYALHITGKWLRQQTENKK